MSCFSPGYVWGLAPPGQSNGGGSAYAMFRDQLASGTLGDVIAATTWTRRTLQTTVFNDIGGGLALRGDNGVDVPAGTYLVWAWGQAANAAAINHRLRLVDSGGAELARGSNWRDANAASSHLAAVHAARITFAAADVIYIEHYSAFGGGAGALGAPMNPVDGGVEVYCELLIQTYS